jgi:hypothetical protein
MKGEEGIDLVRIARFQNPGTTFPPPPFEHTSFIQRKHGNTSNVLTTGNVYQYSRLLQIYPECTVRPDYYDCLPIVQSNYSHKSRED